MARTYGVVLFDIGGIEVDVTQSHKKHSNYCNLVTPN